MRVLLTGATGFLGGHIARRLAAGGHEVLLLVRHGSAPKVPIDLRGFRCFQADGDFGLPFGEPGVDAVVHCATAYGRAGGGCSAVAECNVMLPLRLLDLALSHGAKCFVNADSFFRRQADGGAVGASSYMPAYTLSKLQFVQWARLLCDGGELAFCNMEIHQMYGEFDSPDKFVPWLIERCLRGDSRIALRNPGCLRDFIHVEDVASAFATALDSCGQLGGGFHELEVGLGEARTIESFARMVAEVTRSRACIVQDGEGRPGEIPRAAADPARLRSLGWAPTRTNHAENIARMLDAVRQGIRATG